MLLVYLILTHVPYNRGYNHTGGHDTTHDSQRDERSWLSRKDNQDAPPDPLAIMQCNG